ncbi:MAG: hypothetical protein SGBAC_006285 [Bacillariaceae sp.]
MAEREIPLTELEAMSSDEVDIRAAVPLAELENITSGIVEIPEDVGSIQRSYKSSQYRSGSMAFASADISESGRASLLDDDDDEDDESENISLSWSFRRSHKSGNSRFTGATMQKSEKNKKKVEEMKQELKINKLNYEVDVVGREKEISVLRTCIDRFVAQTPTDVAPRKKELILIKGYAGVGKTRLVDSIKKLTRKYPTGWMTQGTYTLNRFDEPYSGIAAAFGDLIRAAKENHTHLKEEDIMAIGDEVVKELGTATRSLVELIPALATIAVVPSSELESVAFGTVNTGGRNFEADFQRMKHAFRTLTRALCSRFGPFVVVLDGLQWADAASLRTIDFLLSDTLNKYGLIIVGLYRSNEVDNSHPLTRLIEDFDRKTNTFQINMTQMELQPLQKTGINKIIMAMLSIDNEDTTDGLADICSRRTLGNPFFVIAFITMLELEGLLSFNLGLLKWVWEEKKIEKETMSSSNVVDLLQARMEKMSEALQLLLQFAACLGSPFKTFILDTLWEKLGIFSGDATEDVSLLLRRLKAENFIESVDEKSYRWVHDKVQEAALMLGNASEDAFQFNLGVTLYSSLQPRQLDDVLFDTANLLNRGRLEKRPEFAKLNLKAALKARSTSGFQSAATYVKAGIRHLPEDLWSSNRDLTLKLYSLGAEMEVALGNDNVMEEYIEEVLSQSDLSSMEKLPVYIAKSVKLCNVDLNYQATIDLCLDVLKELGSPITTGVMPLPAKATYTLIKTVKAAKKRSLESYERPKVTNDKRLRAIMLFLSRIFYASYFTSNNALLLLAACKMVNISLEHGVSPLTGQAFASLGMIVISVMGDYKTSTNFAQAGLLIQKSFRTKHTQCQAIFLAQTYILCWTKPLQSCHHAVETAHSLGMRSGNIEYAMWSLNVYHTFYSYAMGKPLATLEEPCEMMISQMLDLRQNDQVINSRKWWQLFLNLMGRCDDPLVLKGRAFDVDEFVPTVSNHLPIIRHFESELYLFYGEYQRAADSALKREKDFDKAFSSHAIVMIECFHRGVALYAMARKSKNRKYRTAAAKVRKTVKRWSKNGNPNVKHYDSFLSAEHAALTNNFDEAEVHYKNSIKLAARTGHLHHAGLFNERYSDFLKVVRKDPEEANYRISEAIRWYGEWGALRKVEMLQNTLFEE